MKNIKRYDMKNDDLDMEEYDDGRYVKYEDIVQILQNGFLLPDYIKSSEEYGDSPTNGWNQCLYHIREINGIGRKEKQNE